MDRTNWKYGKLHINILAVALVINKVAVPVVWMMLPQTTKRGNSNTKHRIRLMERPPPDSSGARHPRLDHEPLRSAQNRKSIFRLGLDRIAQMFSNRVEFEDEIYALASWFSRPKYGSFSIA